MVTALRPSMKLSYVCNDWVVQVKLSRNVGDPPDGLEGPSRREPGGEELHIFRSEVQAGGEDDVALDGGAGLLEGGGQLLLAHLLRGGHELAEDLFQAPKAAH